MVRKATAQEMEILPTSPSAAQPHCSTRAAAPGWKNVFPAEVPHGMQMPPTRPAHLCNLMF